MKFHDSFSFIHILTYTLIYFANMSNLINISREEVILKRLFESPQTQNRVITHLSPDLFFEEGSRDIVILIIKYYKRYNRFPKLNEMIVGLDNSTRGIAAKNRLIAINEANSQDMSPEFLTDLIERFIRERKTENILSKAAESIFNKDFSNISVLTEKLSDAINFKLAMNIGLDGVDDVNEALTRLKTTMAAIPCFSKSIRDLTKNADGVGGYYRKSLSVWMGMPNVGKSIILANDAAYAYQSGMNVLYISLELSEEMIWQRIACNVTNIDYIDVVKHEASEIQELLRKNKINNASQCGEIQIRQLPASSTTAQDIENLINEVKINKKYDIDIIFLDYLGIMKPAKTQFSSSNQNLYTSGKEVAEQLRDLARKYEIAIVTAVQMNRDGYDNTQSSMKNTAGSAGINDTADFIATITQDNDLKSKRMYLHTILKNRFGSKDIIVLSNVDYYHMRVTDASDDDIKQFQQNTAMKEIPIRNSHDEDVVGKTLIKTDEQIQETKIKKYETPTIIDVIPSNDEISLTFDDDLTLPERSSEEQSILPIKPMSLWDKRKASYNGKL